MGLENTFATIQNTKPSLATTVLPVMFHVLQITCAIRPPPPSLPLLHHINTQRQAEPQNKQQHQQQHHWRKTNYSAARARFVRFAAAINKLQLLPVSRRASDRGEIDNGAQSTAEKPCVEHARALGEREMRWRGNAGRRPTIKE